jgi:hypothetical protein
MTTAHVHDSFRCPAHVDGCGCPDLAAALCNPYYVAGFCPDAIERMPVGTVHLMPEHGPVPDSTPVLPAPCCGRLPRQMEPGDIYCANPAEVTCAGAAT